MNLARVRLVVGSAAAFYLLVGPAFPQVMGMGERIWPSWEMFSEFGKNVCTVEFYVPVSGDDRTTPPTWGETSSAWRRIDRLRELGYESWRGAPTNIRALTKFSEVYGQARTLCKAGHHEDLRVRALCGLRNGWVEVASGRENACKVGIEVLAEGRKTAPPYEKLR